MNPKMRIEPTALVLLLIVTGVLSPVRLTAQQPNAAPARDYGVGIISFAFSPAPGVDLPAADTLVIYQRASVQSPVVARFLFVAPEALVWSYALETNEDDVQSNALEFDYEVQGLPLDSVTSGGEWVRVIYGMSARGVAHRGWVPAGVGQTQHLFWTEHLAENFLFFLRGEQSIVFFDRLDGERLQLELERSSIGSDPAFDYRLEPLEVDGRWMRVRVVTPNVPCSPVQVEPRERVVWIEYLDERGRPRVWYATRGC